MADGTQTAGVLPASPDRSGRGLSARPLEAGRYDGQLDHPAEVAGLLQAMMPAGKRVLDVGCGTGSVAMIANRNKGNTVIGLEPDGARAAIARSRGLVVEQGFLDSDFIARNGQYDVVMASDVIEHTPDPAAFLDTLRTAARPGGVLLFSTPNVAHWSVRLNLLLGRFDYQPTGIMDATHLRWFTEKTLRALAVECGLEIIEHRYSAGSDLSDYRKGIWRLTPYRVRVPLVRLLTRALPRLFGVQHVLLLRVPFSYVT